MNFKKIFVILSVLAVAACSKVPAGNVGVMFDLYGGDKGVTGQVVGPGKYWLGWNEEIYLFPTFTQSYTWAQTKNENESITFQDKEGIALNADFGISYAIQAESADDVFQKYRKGVDELTDVVLRNMVRDALNKNASTMDAESIFGSGKTELVNKVQADVQEQVKPLGIIIEKIYLIGSVRLPESLMKAINAKIEATQRAQQRENELQTAAAQAQIEREKARGEADARLIQAEGQAKANKLLSESLTDRLVEYRALEVWDGKLPQVSGGSTPFVDLRK